MNAIPSDASRPSALFMRFGRYVENEHPSSNGAHTVDDLRVALRKDRLVEYSDWSFGELDQVEAESASYGGDTKLTQLFA